ncbi:MAG: aminoglycoside phosphotransferase [Ilumatobacteraceae bacterium]|nr:aminoglycoside phosphotransferase [Ilumatobacteraceae bacterium]
MELTADLVRELLLDQHPDLADRAIAFGARGWDNQLWRLGEDLAVRLPWHTDGADALLLKESTWLPSLAPLLPLAVPVPQRRGQPSERYPHPWIVTTWVPGTPADRASAIHGDSAADALAAFMIALHRPAPTGAPAGRDRGGPLKQVAVGVEWKLGAISGLCAAVAGTEPGLIPSSAAIQTIWDDAVTAPDWQGPRLWLHGDLHPANVLTANGDFCGVVDFGDLCAGDPALDLAACWILLPDLEAIRRFQSADPLASDDATWRRARGWAVWRAIGSLSIAAAGEPGGKPSWGPPALASLRRLTEPVTS